MTEGRQRRENVEAPLGLKLLDIYYVLFRQKWLIAAFFVIGMIAGLVVFLGQKTLYSSEAKLLVRYVTESASMETVLGAPTKTTDRGGDTIINSELEILQSLDLCEEVARLVGPEKILARIGGGSNLTSAGVAVYTGLKPEKRPFNNVIWVRFSHPDPAMCQIVLRQLIASYLDRHREIHNNVGNLDEILTQDAGLILSRIRQLEDELQKLHRKAGVISVEEAKKNFGDTIARFRGQMIELEADLAATRTEIGFKTPTNENKTPEVVAPPERVLEYRVTTRLLETARESEFKLLSEGATDQHPVVIQTRERMSEAEKRKQALEKEFPTLVNLYVPTPQNRFAADPRTDPKKVFSLEAKIVFLSNQLAEVRRDLTVLEGFESQISDVKRKLQFENQSYMHLRAGLEAAKNNEKIAASKMSNIQAVQTPSPPAPNVSQRLKLVGTTFFGILAAGIALAFFMEIFVDHTIRRPGEFESKLRMPLFLSIPKLGLNGHAKLLPFPAPTQPVAAEGADIELKQTWAADHPLRCFIDGVRDATLTHFGGDPHKPKLIGITSCSKGSGVTSLAAGLAGALSETGDGNVLLLNLNYESEAAHPFYRGELACDLADAVELDKRQNGMVLQNLYVATAGNPNDPMTQNLPKQLARVVPKLRVSDYDYIVFDLPPTTPTTMTARLAGMMDLVILVVESEKDTQDTVQQAGKLLARSKAPVSAVLNKVRNPVPKWLQKGA